MARLVFCCAVAALALLAFTPAEAAPKEEFALLRAAMQAGTEAYRKGDFAAAESAFAEAVDHGPQQPRARYNLAAVQARRGEIEQALQTLGRLADMHVTYDLDADADFAALRKLPAYVAVSSRLRDNGKPYCPCTTMFEGTAEPFIAEGIAYDAARGRLLVGSVRTGRIVAIAKGKLTEFAKLPGNYSPFGMAIDAKRGILWVAAATIVQTAGAIPEQRGRSLLFALDAKTGALRDSYDPPAGAKHAFGDVALAADGTVYVTDSFEGSLYRLRPGTGRLEIVGTAGMFISPQGIVIKPDGTMAVIADYAMGLFSLDLLSGELTPALHFKDQGETTLGIDGLVMITGGKYPAFVATQNGLASPRVIVFGLYQFWIGMDGASVLYAGGAPVADVSLATPDGKGGVYFVAVSQWRAFDDDKPDPVRPVPAWKIVHYAN